MKKLNISKTKIKIKKNSKMIHNKSIIDRPQ